VFSFFPGLICFVFLICLYFNLQNTKRVPWIASQPPRETPCSGLGTLRSWHSWHTPQQSLLCLSVSFSFSFGPCPWKTEKRAEDREEKHLSRCRHRLRSKSIAAEAKQEMINPLQCFAAVVCHLSSNPFSPPISGRVSLLRTRPGWQRVHVCVCV